MGCGASSARQVADEPLQKKLSPRNSNGDQYIAADSPSTSAVGRSNPLKGGDAEPDDGGESFVTVESDPSKSERRPSASTSFKTRRSSEDGVDVFDDFVEVEELDDEQQRKSSVVEQQFGVFGAPGSPPGLPGGSHSFQSKKRGSADGRAPGLRFGGAAQAALFHSSMQRAAQLHKGKANGRSFSLQARNPPPSRPRGSSAFADRSPSPRDARRAAAARRPTWPGGSPAGG